MQEEEERNEENRKLLCLGGKAVLMIQLGGGRLEKRVFRVVRHGIAILKKKVKGHRDWVVRGFGKEPEGQKIFVGRGEECARAEKAPAGDQRRF